MKWKGGLPFLKTNVAYIFQYKMLSMEHTFPSQNLKGLLIKNLLPLDKWLQHCCLCID